MKTWKQLGMLGGVVLAAVLLATPALAQDGGGGSKGKSSAGSAAGNGGQSGNGRQTRLRQQLRDGSCKTLSADELAARGGEGRGQTLRKRDGSCENQ